MKTFLRIHLVPLVFAACFVHAAMAAAQSIDDLPELVRTLKTDSRGPFKSIAWFCPDGTVLPASQRCAQPGGVQRGVHKDIVTQLEGQGIYLGQVLPGHDRSVFLDKAHDYSRARQYQIEAYLRRVDDGWIMRHARQYRGALSAADEEAWGGDFLEWLLTDDAFVASQFFWARELARDIPHAPNEERSVNMRGLAERLANGMPDFLPIAAKINSQPDSTDLRLVREFRGGYGDNLPAAAESILVPLESELEWVYEKRTMQNLAPHFRTRLNDSPRINRMLQSLAATPESDVASSCAALAELLASVRDRVDVVPSGGARLALLDLSLVLERLLARKGQQWHAATVGELIGKCAVLARACAGCGYVDSAEWASASPAIDATMLGDSETLVELWKRISAARGLINAAVAVEKATFGGPVELFSEFEPIAADFFDDRISRSILLPLGDAVGRLSEQFASRAGIHHEIVEVDSIGSIRGLNPGVAVGELVVVHGRADNFAFEADKIYVLQNAPSGLGPVAGLLSVNEGNPVLQPQRLAGERGMPNAAIALRNLSALTAQSGRLVFFAVSPVGRVVVKSTWDMTPQERELFAADQPAPVSAYLERLDPKISPNIKIGMAEPAE